MLSKSRDYKLPYEIEKNISSLLAISDSKKFSHLVKNKEK